MATEIEKQFFDTFGIEQIEYTQCTSIGCKHIYGDCNNCQFHNVYKIDYPLITDRILLELICILAKFEQLMTCCYMTIAEDVEQLKIDILEDCIEYSEHIKQQVQALFKEGEDEET